MESFFWPATGKKLPGKHGQQELIAAIAVGFFLRKTLKYLSFQLWHGFRSEIVDRGLGRAFGS
jgi:hypothetical protein